VAYKTKNRLLRIVIGTCLATLLVGVPVSAQSSLTGNWTGTYTFSIQLSSCQNTTYTSSGNFSATILQSGSFLSGRIDLTNVTLFNNSNCNTTKGEKTRLIFGAIDGSSVTWAVPNDPNGWQFSGTVNGDSITAQVSDVNGLTGSLNITRTTGDAPAADITGSWAGNYSFTDQCPNGGTKSYTGAFTIGLMQSLGKASGVVTMTNVPLYDQNCSTIAPLNMAMSVAGVVSGSTFTAVVFDPSGSFDFPINATISGGGMNGTVSGASATSTTGTFTLSQSSSQPPGFDFSGQYAGSYSEVDNESLSCINIGSLTFSDVATVSINQAGNAVSGALILEGAESVASDGFGGCTVVNLGKEVLPLYGTLSGKTLTLLLPLGGGAAEQFIVNFTGDALTGMLTDSFGDSNSFSATKSIAASPIINAFGASPAAILSGQSVTLSWTTSNATMVSIDNGVGSQPPSASVTVSPAQTTVYTLTATGPGGSVTKQTTVTVSSPLPRRRSARP
jgi:hypothetical protein